MITLFNDSIITPDWLKYGFIGLWQLWIYYSIILLFYFIIKPLIVNEKNKKFWTITFLIYSLTLLTFGGVSSYLNDKMKFDNKCDIDSVKVLNIEL